MVSRRPVSALFAFLAAVVSAAPPVGYAHAAGLAQRHVSLDPVDQVGGSIGAAVADGDRLYIGQGPRVLIWNVADAASPVLLGRSPILEGMVTDLAVHGERVFATVSDAGRGETGLTHLMALNASRVDQVTVDRTWGMSGSRPSLAIAGDKACVLVSLGQESKEALAGMLYVIDTVGPDPAGFPPRFQMHVPAALTALGDRCVYAQAGESPFGPATVMALRPGTGESPVAIGAIGGGEEGVGSVTLEPSQGKLYAYHGFIDPEGAFMGALERFGVDGAGQLSPEARLDGLFSDDWRRPTMTVAGDFLYLNVAPFEEATIQVVDLRDPAQPVLLPDMLTLPWENSPARSGILAQGGGGLYWLGSAIQSWDLAVPEAPRPLTRTLSLMEATDVVQTAERRFVADQSGTVALWDRAAGGAQVRSSMRAPATQGLSERVRLAVDGGRLYAAGLGEVIVANVGDPDRPRFTGVLSGWTASAMAAMGGSLMVTGNQEEVLGQNEEETWVESGLGLDVLDVSAPAGGRRLASVMTKDAHADMALSDGRLYVVGGKVALRVLDVRDVSGPIELGRWEGGGHGQSVAVAGNLALVSQTSAELQLAGGLSVIDVSRPDHPARLAFVPMEDAGTVALDGPWAYVAAGPQVHLFDLSVPDRPRRVASTRIGGPVHRLLAEPGRVWVAAGERGLLTIERRLLAYPASIFLPALAR